MTEVTQAARAAAPESKVASYDAVIIGTGVAGLYLSNKYKATFFNISPRS